jgi:hypothetical protein
MRYLESVPRTEFRPERLGLRDHLQSLESRKGPKKSRGGKEYGARQHAHQGDSFPPGFGGTKKQKLANGGQLGGGIPLNK